MDEDQFDYLTEEEIEELQDEQYEQADYELKYLAENAENCILISNPQDLSNLKNQK